MIWRDSLNRQAQLVVGLFSNKSYPVNSSQVALRCMWVTIGEILLFPLYTRTWVYIEKKTWSVIGCDGRKGGHHHAVFHPI